MNISDLLSSLRGGDAVNQAADQAGVDPAQAHDAMGAVLEHMAAGGGAEEAVGAVAAKVGISPEQVQALLPHILPLLQRHADNASGEDKGVLGGVLGRLGGLFG